MAATVKGASTAEQGRRDAGEDRRRKKGGRRREERGPSAKKVRIHSLPFCLKEFQGVRE